MKEARSERSHWRDEELSARHRMWGIACPAVDIDFLIVEYNYASPVAIIDYKLRTLLASKEPDRQDSSHQAIGKLASQYRTKPLPYLVVFYRKDPWVFRLIPMNDEADRQLKSQTYILSERKYVAWLYKLRGNTLPPDVAQKLDTFCPPQKEKGTTYQPLSNLISAVKQSSLFIENETDKKFESA